MGLQLVMRRFAKWHIWLGWVIGLPFLMWCVTGLVMVARPIEEVRGEALQAAPAALPAGNYSLPPMDEPIVHAELVQQPIGPVWIVTTTKGGRYRYDARGGWIVSPLDKSDARVLAQAAYRGQGKLETVTYFPGDSAPADLRRPVASWQAHFSDGTNLYFAASTGEVLALRTGWWRAYDLMWSLHIMNLRDRDNPHHPLIIVFAVLGILGALLGCTLLFRRRKARPGA
jgi:uncharacterized iron-regulated membrane protein